MQKSFLLAPASAIVMLFSAIGGVSAQTLQPPTSDAELRTDLVALYERIGPSAQASQRWLAAVGAGLPQRADEYESIRSQFVDIDQDARVLRDYVDTGSTTPHLQRATQATNEGTSDLIAAVDLAKQAVDLTSASAKPSTGDLQTGLAASRAAQEHLNQALRLFRVALLEAQADADPATSTGAI